MPQFIKPALEDTDTIGESTASWSKLFQRFAAVWDKKMLRNVSLTSIFLQLQFMF